MKYIIGLVSVVAPTIVLAADLGDTIDTISGLIASLIPLVIGIAVVVFIWGILKYVVAKDEDSQKEARSVMIYGIIVLFVMVAVWGLVDLLANTLGVDADGSTGGIRAPGIPS